jgi:hypothetical protein
VDATDEKEERQTKQVAGDVSRTMRALDKQLKVSIREPKGQEGKTPCTKPTVEQQDEPSSCQLLHTGFAGPL